MDAEALQELSKIRAQLADNKNVKKVVKEFYRLLSVDTSGEELLAAHETFLFGLDQAGLLLSKTGSLQRVTDTEVHGYESGAVAIEASQAETTVKLATLSDRLAAAQRDRARTIEYDAIAKRIGKLPARFQGEESKAKLGLDIEQLIEEQKTYAATWQSRLQSFDSLVEQLTSMSDAIKDEKMEQERRRALDEDDGEEPPSTLDPGAAAFEPGAQAMAVDQPMPDADEGELEEGEAPVMEGIELEEGQEREEKEEGEEREEGEA